MAESLICARSFEFSSRILKLGDRLWIRSAGARHVAKQVMESGTSIGSNAEEAQEGQTKPDYIAKMSISRKEARETIMWLRLLVKNDYVKPHEVAWEIEEATQLWNMIRAAIRTAKRSTSRGSGT
jgi:four helix bundle protein